MNSTAPTAAAVNASLAGLAKPSAETSGSESMDQTAFLKLFTTQLQNQNPLDPVKNEAFVAQLAQFSQLEATTGMSNSLKTMASTQQSDRLMTGASLIGKKVSSPEGTAQLVHGASINGMLSVPQGASSVNLDVYDRNGVKVFSQQMGRQAPGDLKVSWNGYNTKGELQPEGRYNVIATVDVLGKITQVPISTPSTVKSVTYSAAGNELQLELEDGTTVPLSKVQRIDS